MCHDYENLMWMAECTHRQTLVENETPTGVLGDLNDKSNVNHTAWNEGFIFWDVKFWRYFL